MKTDDRVATIFPNEGLVVGYGTVWANSKTKHAHFRIDAASTLECNISA